MTQPAPAPAPAVPAAPAPIQAPAQPPQPQPNAVPAPGAPMQQWPAPGASMPYLQPAQTAPPMYAPQPYMQMSGMPGYPQYVPVAPLPAQPPAATPAATPVPAPAGGAPAAPTDAGTSGEDRDISKLPQWAQKEVADLRNEAAKRRIQARNAVVSQHAQAAAAQFGVDPSRLLGCASWAGDVERLDPQAPDFAVQLTGAIYRAVTAHPWVLATPPVPGQPPGQPIGQPPVPPVPGSPPEQPPSWAGWPAYPGWPVVPQSGGHFPGGNGAPAAITEADLARMSPQEVAKAFDEGRLKHLM